MARIRGLHLLRAIAGVSAIRRFPFTVGEPHDRRGRQRPGLATSAGLFTALCCAAGSSDAAPTAPAPPTPAASAPENLLPAVQVKGRAKVEQTRLDRKVYRVAEDLQALTGSAADILNSLPSVVVDADGNLTLRGAGNVMLLIDGKPSSSLTGAKAGEALLQLAAGDIERVEVMTHPPAQYAVSGTGGAINIATKKNRQAGASGSLQLSAGNAERAQAAFSGAYGAEAANLSANFGLKQDTRKRHARSQQASLPGSTAGAAQSHGQLDENAKRFVRSLKLGGDMRLAERRSLSASHSVRQRDGDRFFHQLPSTQPAASAPGAASTRHSDGHEWSLNEDQSLRLKQGFADPDEALKVSLSRGAEHERERYAYTDRTLIPPGTASHANLFLSHDLSSRELGLDYSHAPAKGPTLRLGLTLQQVDIHNLKAGNDKLLPQETQSAELGYRVEQGRQTHSITAYLRQNRNSVTNVTRLLSPDVSLSTLGNLPVSRAAGLEFGVERSLAASLTPRASGNLFHTQIDASGLGFRGLRATTGLNLKGSLDWRPTPTDTAQLSVSRVDKRLTPQGSIAAVNLVKLGMRRQVAPDLAAFVTVSDVFNGQRSIRTLNTPEFSQTFDRRQPGRVAFIGMTYIFGTNNKKAKTPTFEFDSAGYLWSYCSTQFSPLQAIVFDFADSRGGQHARDFLGLPGTPSKPAWQGKLVCDDFVGYKACFELGVTEVGCMAHARRKFHELWANHGSQIGEQALKFFGHLYEVERAAANADSQARLEARQAARPLADVLNQWLRQQRQRQRVPDGSATARAIDYSLKRWAALTRYLNDGDWTRSISF